MRRRESALIAAGGIAAGLLAGAGAVLLLVPRLVLAAVRDLPPSLGAGLHPDPVLLGVLAAGLLGLLAVVSVAVGAATARRAHRVSREEIR